jgi:hypothetical protein
VSSLHIDHSIGTTDIIDLNFRYAAEAAIHISGIAVGSSASAVSGVLRHQRRQYAGQQS